MDDGPYNTNCHFIKWQLERADSNISLDVAAVASVWDPFDALLVGPYAAHNSLVCILEDPQDLDSVNSTFTLFEVLNGKISKLVFLGNAMIYTNLDKQLLAKAVVHAKSDHQQSEAV